MFNDHLEHPIRIVQHLIIPEPQHAKPLIFKPLVAALIGVAASMLAAIDLHDQALRQTDKIDDVPPGIWRLNLKPAKRRARSRYHNRRSASVILVRRALA
jgi:hypothetical protein